MLQIMEFLTGLSVNLGSLGTFLGMFLASSVLPIPSEVVMFGVGIASSNPFEIAVYSALGSSLGAIVAYYIGKKYGKSMIQTIGKYFFITQKVEKATDRWFKKYGMYTILFARVIPVIPHKIFSILAGVSNMEFRNFFLMTLLGSTIRSFFLVYFGSLVNRMDSLWIILSSIVLVFVLPLLFSKIIEHLKY